MNEELVVVGIAEGRVAVIPEVLVTYALGSCVGVCLYDSGSRIAGMVHILLPSRGAAGPQNNPYKFADSGIDCLLAVMKNRGAVRSRITAKLAGGARMFQMNGTSEGIGERNLRAVRASLKRLGIQTVAEDTGEDYGRTIYFHSSTGILRVKSVKRAEQWL